MVKLKKGPTMHGNLQNAIVAAINDSNYSFSLPKLADWESIVTSSADEKQRLEFVGDAVMHLSVALYLYHLFPDASPGLYTNIRSAVNTNATFTHLMAKAGAYELPSESHSTKAAADSFEVIVAALYFERGFAEVTAWVQEQYAPLIAAARRSYDECLSAPHRKIPLLSTKRAGNSLGSTSTPLLKKLRLSNARSSPLRTLMAQRVINRMKSKGKVKLYLPAKRSKLPLERRLHSCELRTPDSQRRSPPVIDLTVDTDDDDQPPVNSTAACRSEFKPSIAPLINASQLSDTARRSHQGTDKSTPHDWLPEPSPSVSPIIPSHRSPPPSVASPIATLPDRVMTTVPQPTFEFSRRSGLSLSAQSIDISIASGGPGNPIVIEDSDSED